MIPSSTITERLLTVKEVAEHFVVSENWVHKHASGASRPILPSVRIGKHRRFTQQAVADYITLCQRLAEDAVELRRKKRRAA